MSEFLSTEELNTLLAGTDSDDDKEEPGNRKKIIIKGKIIKGLKNESLFPNIEYKSPLIKKENIVINPDKHKKRKNKHIAWTLDEFSKRNKDKFALNL